VGRCIVNHHQLIHDDAQLHPARVSIEASTKEGSASFLAVIFVIAVLALADSNTKSSFADFAIFLLAFLIANPVSFIFYSFGSKSIDTSVFSELFIPVMRFTRSQALVKGNPFSLLKLLTAWLWGLFGSVAFISRQFGSRSASSAIKFVGMVSLY
jgi:hypothetical protein